MIEELYKESMGYSYFNRMKEAEEEVNVLYKQIGELKQENKELKEEKQAIKSYLGIESKTILERLEELDEWKHNDKLLLWKYRSALEEILESAKFAQCLPCGSGNLEDCLNCDDETTNNGQFCMEKRIHEIKTKCVEVLNESN